MSQLLFKSFPVQGIEPDGDDIRVVGKCSDGDVDLDGDIVSPAWMKSAVDEWLRICPAVRLEHQDYAAGLGLSAWQTDDGATWVKSRIADEKAKALVKSGRLRAYSVGIHAPLTRAHPRAPRWEIYGGRLTEVSIVSSPSNQRCGVTVCKSVGGVPTFIGKAFKVPKNPGKVKAAHWAVLPNCTCGECMKARKSCGCAQCGGMVKTLRKAADPVKAVKAARRELAAWDLNSGDPFVREAALRRYG